MAATFVETDEFQPVDFVETDEFAPVEFVNADDEFTQPSAEERKSLSAPVQAPVTASAAPDAGPNAPFNPFASNAQMRAQTKASIEQPMSDIMRRVPAAIASAGLDTGAGVAKMLGDLEKTPAGFLVPGTVAGATGRALGLGSVTDWTMDLLRSASERAKVDYGVDPKYDQSVTSEFITGGASLVPAIASGPLAPLAMAGMMGESGRREAEEAGGTRGQQEVAFYGNAAVGVVSEALLGVPALLRSARAASIPFASLEEFTKSAAWQFIKGGVREGVQEGVIENTAGNFIANTISGYDPKRGTFDNFWKATLLGAAIGAPVGAVIQTAQNYDSQDVPREIVSQASTEALQSAVSDPEFAKHSSYSIGFIEEELGRRGSPPPLPTTDAAPSIADTSWRGGEPPPIPQPIVEAATMLRQTAEAARETSPLAAAEAEKLAVALETQALADVAKQSQSAVEPPVIDRQPAQIAAQEEPASDVPVPKEEPIGVSQAEALAGTPTERVARQVTDYGKRTLEKREGDLYDRESNDDLAFDLGGIPAGEITQSKAKERFGKDYEVGQEIVEDVMKDGKTITVAKVVSDKPTISEPSPAVQQAAPPASPVAVSEKPAAGVRPAIEDAAGKIISAGAVGQTHRDLKSAAVAAGNAEAADAAHVFVDENGRTLTREEAWTAAKAAGQIAPETISNREAGGNAPKLQSEDLIAPVTVPARSKRRAEKEAMLADEPAAAEPAREASRPVEPTPSVTQPLTPGTPKEQPAAVAESPALRIVPHGKRFRIVNAADEQVGKRTYETESNAQRALGKIGKRSTFGLPPSANDNDIIDAIIEQGGVNLSGLSKEEREHLFPHRGAWRIALTTDNSSMTPDEVARLIAPSEENAANGIQSFGDGDMRTMFALIGQAIQNRSRLRDQRKAAESNQKTEGKQARSFERAAMTPQEGATGTAVSELKVGDEVMVDGERLIVTDIDPDNGNVTFKDGSAFGKQIVEDGRVIYGELTESKTDVLDDWPDLDTPEKAAEYAYSEGLTDENKPPVESPAGVATSGDADAEGQSGVRQVEQERAREEAYRRAYALAEKLGDLVAKGQPTAVREAAVLAATQNAFASIEGSPDFKFNYDFMLRSAKTAAGKAAKKQGVELDAPLEEGGDVTGQDLLASQEPTPAEAAASKSDVERVNEMLSVLSARERTIVNRISLDGDKPADVAADLGISRQRVEQIHAEAMEKLQKRAAEERAVADKAVVDAAEKEVPSPVAKGEFQKPGYTAEVPPPVEAVVEKPVKAESPKPAKTDLVLWGRHSGILDGAWTPITSNVSNAEMARREKDGWTKLHRLPKGEHPDDIKKVSPPAPPSEDLLASDTTNTGKTAEVDAEGAVRVGGQIVAKLSRDAKGVFAPSLNEQGEKLTDEQKAAVDKAASDYTATVRAAEVRQGAAKPLTAAPVTTQTDMLPGAPESDVPLFDQRRESRDTGKGAPMSVADITAYLRARFGLDTSRDAVRVVYEPSGNWDGRWMLDGSGIRLNASKIRSERQLERVMLEELAHGFTEDPANAKATKEFMDALTPAEHAEIAAEIERLGYGDESVPFEQKAKTMRNLAAKWKTQPWFRKLLGRILQWARKLGLPLHRLAAEKLAMEAAMRTVADVRGDVATGVPGMEPARASRAEPSGVTAITLTTAQKDAADWLMGTAIFDNGNHATLTHDRDISEEEAASTIQSALATKLDSNTLTVPNDRKFIEEDLIPELERLADMTGNEGMDDLVAKSDGKGGYQHTHKQAQAITNGKVKSIEALISKLEKIAASNNFRESIESDRDLIASMGKPVVREALARFDAAQGSGNAAAIEAGVAHLRGKPGFDETKAREFFADSGEQEAPAPEPPNPDSTSNKESVVNQELAAEGFDPVTKEEKIANIESLDKAKETLAQNPNRGSEIVARLNSDNPHDRTISLQDGAVMLVERKTLQNQRAAAAERSVDPDLSQGERDAARITYSEVDAKIQAMNEAAQGARSTWGRFGQFWQQMLKSDFTFDTLRRKLEIAKGDKLDPKNPADAALLKKFQEDAALHEKQSATIAELEKAQADKAEQAARIAELEKMLAEAGKPKTEKEPRDYVPKKPLSKSIIEFLDNTAQSARGRIRARRAEGKLFSNPVMEFADEAIYGAAKIAKGVVKFSKWSSEMLAELGEYTGKQLKDIWQQSKARLETAIKDGPRDISAERESTVEGLKAAAEAQIAETGGIDPKKLHKYARALARQFIDEGMTKMEDIDAAVHAAIKEAIPTITERESGKAWTGYGDWKPASTDPAAVTLANVTGERRAALKLEGVRDLNEPRQNTGQGRQPPTAQARITEKEAARLEKEKRLKPVDPERAHKTAMDSVKNRLRNEIEELDFALATRKRIIRDKSGIEYDQEAKDLQSQRDAKKAEYESVFPKEPITQEEQLRRAAIIAERNAEAWEKRAEDARKGIFPTKEKARGPINQRIQAARDQAAALRAEVAHLRDLANPKLSPAMRALRAERTRLIRSIADKTLRIYGQEFSPKPKPVKPAPATPKEKAADIELNTLRAERARTERRFEQAKERYRLEQRTRMKKIWDGIKQAARARTNILSSIDLSAPRQAFGYMLSASSRLITNPKVGYRMLKVPFGAMFQAAKSERVAERIEQEIGNRINRTNGVDKMSGVQFQSLNETAFTKGEENAHSILDQWAEAGYKRGSKTATAALAVPLTAVKAVRASNRAFITFLNAARAQMLDELLAVHFKHREPNPAEIKQIGDIVNLATGRANVSRGVSAAMAYTPIWSPHLLISRLQGLAGQPFYSKSVEAGGKTHRSSWKSQAIVAEEYARVIAMGWLLMQMTRLFTDDDDEVESTTSSDYGKAIIEGRGGDTRVDPWGGFQQHTVLASRLINNKTTSIKGKERELGSYGLILTGAKFVRSKLDPTSQLASNIVLRSDWKGEETTPATLLRDAIPVPLSLGQTIRLIEAHGLPKAAALQALQEFGVGVNNYEDDDSGLFKPSRQ